MFTQHCGGVEQLSSWHRGEEWPARRPWLLSLAMGLAVSNGNGGCGCPLQALL